MNELRVFFGHSIAHTDTEVDAMASTLLAQMQRAWPDQRVSVTTGKTDWLNRIAVAGTWEDWAREVCVNRADGEPRYHAVVVPVGQYGVGRAIESVVRTAWQRKVPVYQWHEVDHTVSRWESA